MIELVMSVCAIASPYNCKDVALIFDELEVTERRCFTFAQMPMASWIGDHPGWHISSWTCRPAGQFANL